MTKIVFIYIITSCIMNAGEVYRKESYLPAQITEDMVLVTIDAAFGGTLTVLGNEKSGKVAFLYFAKNGKVNSRMVTMDEELSKVLQTIRTRTSLMNKEERDRRGEDGYTLTIEMPSGKTVVWSPSNLEMIKALRILCLTGNVPHNYVENGNRVDFYPGPKD
jgi:hypothetical protein